ncbi:MAG TPA: hypothetical protein VNZ86_03515 [Bacteroidia bacterium]|jgi:hypothetical protein|nr:hypothetical protein [Bacteroidia bacterium]
MIFKGINIRDELLRKRQLQHGAVHSLLSDVKNILKHSEEKDKQVLARLTTPNYTKPVPVSLRNYDPQRLFSKEEIHEICSRYRLRFLDSSYFKNEFPYDALAEINRFEKENGLTVEKFKIIAPPHLFKLEDRCKKDPLLFAQVGENSFYLLHQWGHDLAWYREWLVWPLKNIYTTAYALFALSFIITLITPLSWIIRNETNPEQILYYRIAYFAHTLIFLFGFTLFLGMTFRKNFSEQEWDNECFN